MPRAVMMSIGQLMRLPWTVRGPVEKNEDGSMFWEIRIDELPDFFVAEESQNGVMNELLPALRAYLEAHVEN